MDGACAKLVKNQAYILLLFAYFWHSHPYFPCYFYIDFILVLVLSLP